MAQEQQTSDGASASQEALPSGMPNIPGMSKYWDIKPQVFQLDAFNWVQVLTEYQSRWFAVVSLATSAPWLLHWDNTQGLDEGLYINNGAYEIVYANWGPRVGGNWYVYGLGAVGKITVYQSAIRLR